MANANDLNLGEMAEMPKLVRQNAAHDEKMKAYFVSARNFYYVDSLLDIFTDKTKALEILAQRHHDPVVVNLVKLVDLAAEKTENELQKQLGPHIGCFTKTDELKAVCDTVCEEMVGEGVNWSRIIAILSFYCELAKVMKKCGKLEIVKNFAAEFLDIHANKFLAEQIGGWDSIIPYAEIRHKFKVHVFP